MMGLTESVENFTNRELLETMGEYLDALAKRVSDLERKVTARDRVPDEDETVGRDPPRPGKVRWETLAEPGWWNGCRWLWGSMPAWDDLVPNERRKQITLADTIIEDYREQRRMVGHDTHEVFCRQRDKMARAEALREAADMVAEKLRLEESIRRLAEKDDK